MSKITPMLGEFDHEMATTRKVLAAVPWNKRDYKPHEKSMSLGNLATHLQQVVKWCKMTVTQDEVDMKGPYTPPHFDALEELLSDFDSGIKECRGLLENLTDEQCLAMWSLKKEGEVMFAMPRIATLRAFVMSHMIHHRGQLSVYLRLLDVPVPSIYGPSADNER